MGYLGLTMKHNPDSPVCMTNERIMIMIMKLTVNIQITGNVYKSLSEQLMAG